MDHLIGGITVPPRRVKAVAIFSIAARFQVPIWVEWTPYFLDNSAMVISSRIASSATLALKSGEWFFRFFIRDHFFLYAIHPLTTGPKFRDHLCASPAVGLLSRNNNSTRYAANLQTPQTPDSVIAVWEALCYQ